MTTKKQTCFAVLICITLLLMVVIISAEFTFSFSFSADSKKIKLGQQKFGKFFPGLTEEDGAPEYPEFEIPVFSDINRGVLTDQEEFILMADWLIKQQRLHGGHARDFLPEHLKYLAEDPNMHELETTEQALTTELATTPPVIPRPSPGPNPGGEDQIQPEAEVKADYNLDSGAGEVSLQHQEGVLVGIQGNTEVGSPVGKVTIGETRESAEPATNEADPATTPTPPTTPIPPTTPEPETSPTPTEEESSTMSDTRAIPRKLEG